MPMTFGKNAALALFVAFSSPVAADDQSRIDTLDAFAKQFRSDKTMPSLSIAIARDGDILFTGNYGFQDHDAEEVTTAETSYLVASITKTFTAITLLGMEADGHISLEDDFTTFSEWDRRCNWLVNSGIIFGGADLGDLKIPAIDCAATISLEDVLSHRVNGEPGADFIYNPIIFGRLSHYVEEKTGRPWREWMKQYVTEPGNLSGLSLGWRDPSGGAVLTNFAPPFEYVENEAGEVDYKPSALPNTELNASSGVIASAAALARYGVALMDGKILSNDLLARMWTPTLGAGGTREPYGLGWYVEEINGRKVVWHGGWWPDAYAGMLILVPEEKLAFVALGNTDGLHWGNPLNGADITASPLAKTFMDLFVE